MSSTPKPPHPVDASWLRLLDAVDALVSLVLLVRAAETALFQDGQDAARARAADAMGILGIHRFALLGVAITLTSARTSPDGSGGWVIVGRSYVRVKLDPGEARRLRLRRAMSAQGGETIVDLLERREALRAAS